METNRGQTVKSTKESVEMLKLLTELRTLWIENAHRADCESMFASLSNMEHLPSLPISANCEHEPLDFEKFDPGNIQLQKLITRGCWDNGTFRKPVFCTCGKKTSSIWYLSSCKNGTGPLPTLSSNLPNLIYLSIRPSTMEIKE